jgi:hypothetical protein
MKRHNLVIHATLLLAAACSSSTAPNNSASSGTVSFTYTGAGGGSYNATGAVVATSAAAQHASTWASAFNVSADNSILVFSNKATNGGLADQTILVVARQTPGTSSIATSCEPTETSTCSFFAFVIGGDATGEDFDYSCFMASGSITISEVSGTRVSGTFSGAGLCVNGDTFELSNATVSNGSFAVPFLTGPPVFFQRASAR